MTDPDHGRRRSDPDLYRLLSGKLTRAGDQVIVEGDVFEPTQDELDAFGDRMTRVGDDSDASARETGHPLAVTDRSYHMMKNYDSRELQPRSSGSGPGGRAIDWSQPPDPSEHPQSEEQQNLPEPPDVSRPEPRFGIPKRSPLSSGTPWRNLAEGKAAGDMSSDTTTSPGVDDAVRRIETLARDYADNDVDMTNAEYEQKLDDILADMDVGDAIDALEETDIGGIRV